MALVEFGNTVQKNMHVFVDGGHATHKTSILEQLAAWKHPVSLGDFEEACATEPRFKNKHKDATLSKLYDLAWYNKFVEVDKRCSNYYILHDRCIFSGQLYDAIRQCHATLCHTKNLSDQLKKQIIDKFVKSFRDYVDSMVKSGFAPNNHNYVFLRVDPQDYEKILESSQKRGNGLDIMDTLYIELEDRFFGELADRLGPRARVVTTKLDDESDRMVMYLILAMTNIYIFAMGGHPNEGDNSVDLLVARDTLVTPGVLTSVECSTSVLFGRAYNGIILGKSSNSSIFSVHPGLVDPFYMLPLTVSVSVPKLEGSTESLLLRAGDRIAQMLVIYMPLTLLVPARPLEVNLEEVSRGGFGSTSKVPRIEPVEAIRGPLS